MIFFHSRLRIVLIGFGLIVSCPTWGFAQVPSALSLLEEVLARYQTTMEADFVHTLTSEIMDGSQTLTGHVQLKGSQYRIETLYEVIIGQGDEAWIYRPQEKQVLITRVDDPTRAYSPSALFQSYGDLYHAHTSSYELVDGVAYFRLELSPIDSEFEITSLTLWIREQDRIITRMVALDQSSIRTVIELENVRIGIPISPEIFEFSPPEGVEVIDLRS